jgi:uncharacterized protein (TIGR00251 family)
MNFAPALMGDKTHTVLRVHVVPGAKEYFMEYDEWRKVLKVKVKAQPKQGKANQDVLEFLGKYFSSPVIISGTKDRFKRVKIQNSLEETVKILGEILK